MTWLYDTHIHLSDPEYRPYINTVIQNMKHTNIKACCVSMDAKDSKETLKLSRKSDLVLPFIGIHPEKADDDLESVIKMIQDNTDNIAGIGEIGLDPTFSNSDLRRQKYVFEQLLFLAEKYDKPISIHSRKSLDDILSIIPSYSINNACLHWFDGNKRQLRQSMDMGLFVSYGPVMVYANDKQSLLSKTHPDRILVETDGPVKFSRCFGFKPAQTSFIPSVIFAASKILRRTYEEMCLLLEVNSRRFLHI